MFKDKMTMLAPPNVLKVLLPPIEQCIGNGNRIKKSDYLLFRLIDNLFLTNLLYFRQGYRNMSVFVQLHKVCTPY